MDFLKIRKFRKVRKSSLENDDLEDNAVSHCELTNNVGDNVIGKSVSLDVSNEIDDDDDDFITNEVKRRLKELRRNSFMVLIPEEESGAEEDDDDDDDDETSSSDMGCQVEHLYCDFESIYEKYCERMLFFDRMSAKQMKEAGPRTPTTPSPRTASRRLTSSFRCLSMKNIEEPDDETEQLQQLNDTAYQDLETAYVGHICLTWEALHSQYTQLSQKISCHPENPTCYNHCAQQYQQFNVLLQRFIENEPFENGTRVEKYAQSRNSLSKLLQVPNVIATCPNGVEDEDSDCKVLAPELLKLIETSILTFFAFLRVDKKKSGGVHNQLGSQNEMTVRLRQVQSAAQKKVLKLKELGKNNGSKTKSWPEARKEVEFLFALIDCKIVSRVLKMEQITKEQLLWCEDKMRKLNWTNTKLRRDPSPVLFPC